MGYNRITSKQGQKVSNKKLIVKHQNNKKRVIIAITLALVGVAIYFVSYQYTYQAKLEQEYNQVQQELDNKNKTLDTSTKSNKKLQQQVDKLEKQRQKLEKELQAKRANQIKVAQTPRAQASPVKISGTKQDWLRASGIPESQWVYVDYIVSRESSWNPNAVNASSGACGLGQQLPCGKWAGAWNDPVAALKAQYGYVNARYGGYAQAYSFWLSNSWY